MKKLIVALLVLAGGVAWADEPTAHFQLGERGSPHAGVPFTLILAVDGFDPQPAPDQPKIEIFGAKVTALPVPPPNVTQMTEVINGRMNQYKRVTWIFKWRVEVAKQGRITVPRTTISQGQKHATAAPGDVDVDTIATTDDMKLELALPARPVFVGETFEATLTWLFRREPEEQTFTLPLMSLDDFTVSAPPVTDPRHAITIDAGTKQLQLPYAVDQTDVNGQKFNRVTIKLWAAPRRSGKVEVPASSVVAALQYGRTDFFGNAPTRLFRATDASHTLDVKPLPETDKPPSYAGAVGKQFSISVGTSRSVVQLGEPVELAITVKSSERLDTLALQRLDGEGELPKDKFTVPAEAPTGELSDDGKTKTFKVTAQVTGPTTEIPSLAFSYFDPEKGTYQTIHSDPVALSVKGGSVIGAGDVVAAPTESSAKAAPQEADLALVGADLALSAPGDTDDRPLAGVLLWLLVGLMYAIPLGVLAMRTWQLRTRTQREEAAEVRAARKKVEAELARAAKEPARDTAGPLASALRTFARALDREPDDGGLLAVIETESFAPTAAAAPLSADVRQRAEALVKRWSSDARRPTRTAAGAVAALILLALAAPAHAAPADAAPADAAPAPAGPAPAGTAPTLAEGRADYQDAMTQTDASMRRAAFARAAVAIGEAARAHPDEPELLADWGNAALGAGDVATATLAFRRALAIDGSTPRAQRNLGWLRSRQSDTFRPTGGSAADTLFFFHQWPRPRRLLIGAVAFALAVLLIVPWSGRRRRGLSALAVLPVAIWIAMIVSLVLEDRHTDDAVVMDAVVMRAADSAGAPAALTQPLPRGAEVTMLERRDAWTRIRLANGTTGWIPAGAVEPVAPH